MFAEFAFTPSVFDEQANPDHDAWLEQLTYLGAQMFPMLASSPVMVSNLHGGSWHEQAVQMAESVQHHAARRRCKEILRRARATLVFRPAVLDRWPPDDVSWAQEAISSSSRDEPIERITATAETRNRLLSSTSAVRSLSEVLDGGFWRNVLPVGPLRATINDEVEALRKICVHSRFLCLITPYVFGSKDGESSFAFELIKKTFERPNGFLRPEIEIHTMHPSPTSEKVGIEKLARGISAFLQKSLKLDQVVRLVLWPSGEDKDRKLIAGVLTMDSAGRVLRSPRWSVLMSHLAYLDEPTKYHHFSLMSREELDHWFNKYCREGIQGYSLAGTISPSGFKVELPRSSAATDLGPT